MNNAITVSGIMETLGCVAGIFGCGLGLLMCFAGMMSDAGDDGTSRNGCILFVGSLIVGILSLIGLLA